MSFAHANPLIPVGESPCAQKIEFCLPPTIKENEHFCVK